MKRHPHPARAIPLVVVTGVHAESMAAVTVGLQWDLPTSVVVRHHIDLEEVTLTRTVSDASGIIEQEVVHLDHLCVSCALREDILPTTERLANAGRWESIIVHLPLSAEARQLCRVVADSPHLRRRIRVAAVVTALRGATVTEDLLDGESLAGASAEMIPEDDRGLGEVLAAHVEYADFLACVDGCDEGARELLATLARPEAGIYGGPLPPAGATLLEFDHNVDASEAWTATVRRGRLPVQAGRRMWRLDLTSERPFHPRRLMEEIEALGGGRHRSRGCFWLASRPHDVCAWEGCGGHLNIGAVDTWGDEPPLTRLVIAGDWGSGDVNLLAARFHRCLLTDAEIADRGAAWTVAEDGFEPWLGPIEPRPAPLAFRSDAATQ